VNILTCLTPATVIFSTWLIAMHDTDTRYLHRHLTCYTWYMIYDTGARYLHRYLTCYIWHMIPDTGTCHAIFDTWHPTPVLAMLCLTHDTRHRYLPCYICHMTPDTGTCHAIFDTWYPRPVLAMLYSTLDIRHWYLICHTWYLLLTPGIWYAFMWYKYLDLTSWLLTGHYHPW